MRTLITRTSTLLLLLVASISISAAQKIVVKGQIIDALGSLSAGGSTAGGQGIMLAYLTAKKNFIKGGNNRVILLGGV